MGWFSEDEEQLIKNADNSGNVSNVVLGDNANFVQIFLIILTILKFIEIAYIIYTSHVRRIKKRYNNGPGAGTLSNQV